MSLGVALALGVAAVVIGFSKTALGGLAVVSVAIFATVLPARQSTGAILAVLLVGDLVAIWHYRHDCDWHLVRQLVPTVLPGLALGALFLHVVDDIWLRRSIGALLLVMVGLQLALRARPSASRWAAARGGGLATGLGAGFATMTANAAGAVMTLYLVARGWRSGGSSGRAPGSSSGSTCARSRSAWGSGCCTLPMW